MGGAIPLIAELSCCLNAPALLFLFSAVEPSEIQLFVDNTAIPDGQISVFDRGVKVNLRCEAKAEPMPGFKWMVPGRVIPNLMVFGRVRISGIKWKRALSIRGMNCRSSGTFVCLPYNVVGNQKGASVTLGVLGLSYIK